LDDQVDKDNIENFPLARYASRFWTTHARFENASPRIKDGMACLFDADKPHFATWLWMYNEDRTGRSMFTKCPEKPEAVPLYYAVVLGFRDLAEHLIAEHPENMNATGGKQVTPMHVAAFAGHADIVSLLLEHGAHVDSWGKFDETPLHQASSNGRVKVGQCLLDRGADINARDDSGWTPLVYAAMEAQVEFARMLLKRGARVDVPENDSLLHRAVLVGNIQFVRLLLEHGADVNARDKDGETPSQIGSRYGKHEIVELLAKYGAKSVE
jgi:ankyrin repeat protein